MPERKIRIQFPLNGLSENVAFGEQEPGTTRDSLNCRGLNPRNGRVMGAQRSGLSRFHSDAITATSKVSDITMVTFDNKNITYGNHTAGEENELWKKVTPSTEDCNAIQVDRQSNVYALDGSSGVVKYNATGTQLWRISPPIQDEAHVLRALHVDDFDCVYMGVSSGGDQKTARVWKYAQEPDDKTRQIWEIEPDGYVEQVKVLEDKVYIAINSPSDFTSRVEVYNLIDSASPQLIQVIKSVPHPVNEMALGDGGEVFTASKKLALRSGTTMRGPSPATPDTSTPIVSWTPRDLTDFDKRVWSWYDAQDVQGRGNPGGVPSDSLDEGDDVFQWNDISGNGRNLFVGTGGSGGAFTPPTYRAKSLAGLPGLEFIGTQGLISGANPGFQVETADQQRTVFPAYNDGGASSGINDAMYVAFFVIRPDERSTKGTIFFQDNADGAGEDQALVANRNESNANPGSTLAGELSWLTNETTTGAENGQGNNGQPLSVDWSVFGNSGNTFSATNRTGAMIVTLIHDGGVETGNPGTGFTRSILRVNGEPIDRWESRMLGSTVATEIGNSSILALNGTIHEILVLDRQTRGGNTEPKILVHAKYGHQSSGAPDDTAWASPQDDDELSKIEGYLAHKWGLAFQLPTTFAGGNSYGHPFGTDVYGTPAGGFSNGPPTGAGAGAAGLSIQLFAQVCKYDSAGKIVWSATEKAGATNPAGGIGYGVALNSDGNVYTSGRDTSFSNPIVGDEDVRMIVDQGDSFSILGADSAWEVTLAEDLTYDNPRLGVDTFKNLHLPNAQTSSNVGLRVYNTSGSEILNVTLDGNQETRAAIPDTLVPEYESDLTNDVAENTYLASQNISTATIETVHKVQLVKVTSTTGSPRTMVNVAVAGGRIKTFTSTTITEIGSVELDAASQYVQSAVLFSKVYYTDGKQYKVFDPVASTVAAFEATSSGKVPARGKLIEAWRGRMVIARVADNASNWFMSAKDDPLNWDFFPPVPSETQAVAGSIAGEDSAAGRSPDLINTIVSYSDDVLLFGCDREIWMMSGDPASGGRIDLVSDVTGMSFGRPWTKDPNGVLYFFGSRGGLYRMVPGRHPERVSVNRIERRLQDVDLSAYYIRLAYNYRDEGIHIFQMPFAVSPGITSVKHWFYEIKTDSFWEDQFGTSITTDQQPTSAYLLDGDAFNDRTLILGCEDGRIRRWDSAAKNDDDVTLQAVDSFVTVGPLPGMAEGFETQYSGLQVVFSKTDDGARYELFAAEDPEDIDIVRRRGELGPGRNPPKWDRVTGPYCWLRLRNAAGGERWAFERGHINASLAGMARPRS